MDGDAESDISRQHSRAKGDRAQRCSYARSRINREFRLTLQAVKQFLRVDEGTYIPRRFRKREMDATNSLFVPSSGTFDLQIINVFHLGGGAESSWVFEYYTPNDPLRKSVSLHGTDMYVILIIYSQEASNDGEIAFLLRDG